ncbi:MAG: tetratricopeptide repeat protein, partial [Bacteroidales bacterium]
MINRFILFFVITLFAYNIAHSQSETIDSLKNIVSEGDDTTKLKASIDISKEYMDTDIEKAKTYHKTIDSLKEIIDNPKFDAKVIQHYGNFYFKTGEYNKAIEKFQEALSISKKNNSELVAASAYNNIGLIYEKKGNYNTAMEHLLEAAKIWEESNTQTELARVYLNMGLIHFRNENYNLSKNYYEKSLEIRKEINDREGIALVYNNMGILNFSLEKYDQVRNYFQEAYDIYKEEENYRQQAMTLANLGKIYSVLGQRNKALAAYNECIRLEKKLQDRSGLMSSYEMVANLLKEREKYGRAMIYLDSAYHIARSIEATDNMKDIYYQRYEIYKLLNNHQQALRWHEKYFELHDSIFNATKNKQLSEMQAKYETTKKERIINMLSQEKQVQELKLKKQQYLILFIGIITAVVLGFAIILYLQKKKINSTHQKLFKQQKQIKDSIEYASRIQSAILPELETIEQKLNLEHFLLFQPKDVVSGDFPFFEKKDGKKIIAVADCTGHGVPGAFMSILGYSLLTEIIHNSKELKADEILNQLRNHIIQALKQNNEIGMPKDGMDISLCIIDEEKKKIEFAGAYQVMLYISNGKLNRIKGDKMPVGIHYKEKKRFSLIEVQYSKGDMIYLFTDGYPDQFGGKHKKKLRLRNFQDILLTVHHENMEIQKKILQKSLKNWMGSCEQLDDILV